MRYFLFVFSSFSNIVNSFLCIVSLSEVSHPYDRSKTEALSWPNKTENVNFGQNQESFEILSNWWCPLWLKIFKKLYFNQIWIRLRKYFCTIVVGQFFRVKIVWYFWCWVIEGKVSVTVYSTNEEIAATLSWRC